MHSQNSHEVDILKEAQKEIKNHETDDFEKDTLSALYALVFIYVPSFFLWLFLLEDYQEFKKDIGILVIIYIFSLFLSILFLYLLKPRSKKVTDVMSVTGKIKMIDPSKGYHEEIGAEPPPYYYLEITNSNKPIKSTVINPYQNRCISAILKNKNIDTHIKCNVAFIEPHQPIHKLTEMAEGSISLLPFEHYCTYSDNNLIKISENSWVAPQHRGNQPEFSTPREYLQLNHKKKFICEANLSYKMDRIKFLYIDIDTLKEDSEKTISKPNIKNVIDHTHENYQFMDVRTAVNTTKDRKGPGFITCCFIAYLINYFFTDYIEAIPNLSFYINILISTLLAIKLISMVFIPLKVSPPIRLNRINKEIYVFHKESLYRIPWERSDFSIVANQKNDKVTYDLNLWLDPKFDIYRKSNTVKPLTIYSADNLHARVFFFWDYMNRYMKFDVYFEKLKKTTEETEKVSLYTKVIRFAMALLFLPIILIFLSSSKLSLRSKINPFKIKWPKEVHNWSKYTSNWY
ncbi:hypothetical protein SBX64_18915 [Vibrio rhizosphaerae]|uniref:Uncharacterized protein n=1 Tax=Vibrio rhizosphaerae TaxID=398736 RepID=A0ABU4IZC2_9VIBR|nr:hypothetical protein [Vibrio rhizosphaerae]MDW6094619.1 hypothetical protein [Vibrio rhizosphaerae]